MSNIKNYLSRIAKQTEKQLDELLPLDDKFPASIHQLMRYSIFAGGKRVRPGLITAAYETCGGKAGNKKVPLTCAAFEMFHTFSLIHDDLPCMDDDNFRRGKPTAHKEFNEALAVLGGDALCIYAFEVLSCIGRIDIIRETAEALGTSGMIGGQVVDIESEGKQVSRELVNYIHCNKTAALIRASVRTGAMLADAAPDLLTNLGIYGEKVGLAFQVVDDILDEEGKTDQLGKDAGSDNKKGKATYPSVYGMKESKKIAEKLVNDAINAVSVYNKKTSMLSELALFIKDRIS